MGESPAASICRPRRESLSPPRNRPRRGSREELPRPANRLLRPYHLRRNTGTAAASPAPTCNASTKSACLGARGSHATAKNATTGICPAITSCQRCAAAPSSAWRATPEIAMWPRTSAKAANDIVSGSHALGCLIARPYIPLPAIVGDEGGHAGPPLHAGMRAEIDEAAWAGEQGAALP
jgi:hypothetical protein